MFKLAMGSITLMTGALSGCIDWGGEAMEPGMEVARIKVDVNDS